MTRAGLAKPPCHIKTPQLASRGPFVTKAEVIAMLMERTGLSRQDATTAVETFLDQVKAGLQRGEKVSLV